MWTTAGRPRSGDVFNHKKNTKYKYKLAIKDAAVQFEGRFDDELLSNYLRKDFNSFWKTWKNKVQTKHPNISIVSGLSDDKEIANKFAAHFSTIQNTTDDDPCHFLLSSLFLTIMIVNSDSGCLALLT